MKKIILFIFLITYSIFSYSQSIEEKAYKKALDLLKKDKGEKALIEMNKSISINPNFKKALQLRAYYFFDIENYKAAFKDCNKILYRFPSDTNALQLKTLLKIYSGDEEDAEKYIKKCIALDSNDISFYSDLGYAYSMTDENTKAKKYFQKALSKKQTSADWYQLGYVFYNETNYVEALKAFENSLKLNKKNVNALRMKAICFINLQKFADGIKIYEQMFPSGNVTSDDFFNWGLAYYYQKKYDRALRYFQIPKHARNAELYYYTGLCYYQKKNYPMALQAMQKAAGFANVDDEENAVFFYNKSILENQVGDKNIAIDNFYRSVYLSPEIFNKKNIFGDTLYLIGDAAKLLKFNQQKIDSLKVLGWQERARALTENGEYALSNEVIIKALKLDSLNSYTYYLKGENENQLKNNTSAINCINKAINLQQPAANSSYLHTKGLYELNGGDTSAALADFIEVNKLDQTFKDAYYFKAMIYAGRGKTNKAIEEISTLVTMKTEEDFYLVVRAYLYNSNNEFQKALNDCNTVIKKVNDNAEAFYQRGMAYWGLENSKEATKDLNSALELDPDMDEAKEALAEINAGLK